MTQWALRQMRAYQFWVVVGMFVVCTVLYYPQLVLPGGPSSLLFFLGLREHAAERILFLLPVGYAGFVFGTKAGLISLGVATAVMLPRVLPFSSMTADPLFEVAVVVVVGSMVNVWFRMRRKDIARLRRMEETLAKIVDGSPIPMFVIDERHKVTYWNAALESLTGMGREHMIGTDEQWRAFYREKRPVMADLIVDGASAAEVESYYRNKARKSRLIDGAYEAEDFSSTLGETGKWLYFNASPIRDSNGTIIGAIETLQDITHQKNAEMNLQHYLQNIARAQEEERKRIARELHDSTAQTLVALIRQLDNVLSGNAKLPVREAKVLWGFHERVREALQEIRRVVRDLRPSVLDDLGLLPALELVAGTLESEYGVDVSLEVTGAQRRLPGEVELLLFRIVQEALANVAKHAQASKASVKVEFGEDRITVTTSDNGVGFPVPEDLGDLSLTDKFGLAGMQERVRLLGGSISLKSEPGKGTVVFVDAPIPRVKNGDPVSRQ